MLVEEAERQVRGQLERSPCFFGAPIAATGGRVILGGEQTGSQREHQCVGSATADRE
jgi:hypothetical protein